MGEMIQKKFREILDSVSNASDDFVNKYFSDDSVDLDIKVSDDTEVSDDDVEVIKGDSADDWFDYKGNIINDEKSEEEQVVSNEEKTVDTKEESPINETVEEPVVEEDSTKEDILEDNTSNDDIELSIGDNVDITEIENEIKDNSFDDLNLNYNYDELEKEASEHEEKKEAKEETQDALKDNEKEVETVKDTSYKKLSGDELINLLNKTDNGEDFFKEVEVIND